MQGSILEVSVVPAGDELDIDALAAATTLTLVDASDFDPAGGTVDIDGTVYTYTSVDQTTMVMTLSTGLIADTDAGTRVNLSPLVIEKWAMVEAQSDDDAILALVPHSLWDRIDEGVREPEDQESVIVMQQEGDWVVVDIIGTSPTVDGTFTSPGSAAVPSEVQAALDALAAEVLANSSDIANQATAIEDAAETAFAASSLASTADGRVSISDYEPSPTDVQYTAVDVNGDPILDSNGDPVILTRTEGSIWLVRTRSRVNYVTNPSFEANTTHWTASQLTMLRELSAVAVAGSYSCKLTNSGVAGNHSMEWNMGGPPRLAAVEGQKFTASLFAAGVSGTNNGVYLQIQFYTAGGTNAGTVSGAAVNLAIDDYERLSVTAVAPVNTASVVFRVISPTGNEGAVWRIDGAMLETNDILGRYFDGRSYDGSWQGTADLSYASLAGGKVVRIFELDDNAWIEKFFTGDVLKDIDASQILRGAMDGERLVDYSVPQDKLSATPVIASEALIAGDLVNVYDLGGSFRIRKASAAIGALYPAHGFVLTDVVSGGSGLVYSSGYNPFVTGLGPGIQFLSTTPGKCASSPPTDVGTVVQRVGVAGGATVLNFNKSQPIYIK